jgi:hypothetical protein
MELTFRGPKIVCWGQPKEADSRGNISQVESAIYGVEAIECSLVDQLGLPPRLSGSFDLNASCGSTSVFSDMRS